jgi:hypothetical protein
MPNDDKSIEMSLEYLVYLRIYARSYLNWRTVKEQDITNKSSIR